MKNKRFLTFLKGSCLFFLGAFLLAVSVLIAIKYIKYDIQTKNRKETREIALDIFEYEPSDEKVIVSELIRAIRCKYIKTNKTVLGNKGYYVKNTYIWLYGYDDDEAYIQPMVISEGWLYVRKKETFTRQKLWPKRPSTQIDFAYAEFDRDKDKIIFKIDSIDHSFLRGLLTLVLIFACAALGCLSFKELKEFIMQLEKTIFVVSPKSLNVLLAVIRREQWGCKDFGARLWNGDSILVRRKSFPDDNENSLCGYHAGFRTKRGVEKFAEEQKRKRDDREREKKKQKKSKKSS